MRLELQGKINALRFAAEVGNLTKVRQLVERQQQKQETADEEAIINGRGGPESNTALHQASFNGYLEIVRYLVDQGGAIVDTLDGYGHTPLYYAVQGGQTPVVVYLCEEANARIDAERGMTSVSVACMHGEIECLRFLLEKQGANIKTNDYLLAARYGRLEVIRHLCSSSSSNGCVDTAATPRRTSYHFKADSQAGTDALCKASANDQLSVVRYLISEGANVNGRDQENSYTPLALACRNGHLRIAEFLCEKGANSQARCNGNTKSTQLSFPVTGGYLTPLDLASAHGHVSIVRFLFSLGVVATPKALHLATRSGDQLEMVSCLVEEGKVDLGSRDPALHIASGRGHVRLVRYLCSQNAIDINAVATTIARDESTALHLAARSGNLQVVKCLCGQEGININTQTTTGETALHEAAGSGRLAMSLELLNKGANPNAQDQNGNSPFYLALQRRLKPQETDDALVVSLLEKGANPMLVNMQNKTAVSLLVDHAAALLDENHNNLNLIYNLMRAGVFTSFL